MPHIRTAQGELNRLRSLPRGSNHWNFSPRPSVLAVHKWLMRYYGRPNACEYCGSTTQRCDWAKLKGKTYERKRENFIRLCRKCHVRYDEVGARSGAKRLGRPGHMKGFKHSAESRRHMAEARRRNAAKMSLTHQTA